MSDPKKKPEECEVCGFPTDELKFYPSSTASERPFWMCDLCSSTLAGNAAQYPRQYPDRASLGAICYVGNAVLAQLKAMAAKPKEE